MAMTQRRRARAPEGHAKTLDQAGIVELGIDVGGADYVHDAAPAL